MAFQRRATQPPATNSNEPAESPVIFRLKPTGIFESRPTRNFERQAAIETGDLRYTASEPIGWAPPYYPPWGLASHGLRGFEPFRTAFLD